MLTVAAARTGASFTPPPIMPTQQLKGENDELTGNCMIDTAEERSGCD